jgi:hypothetical protein
VKLGLIVGYWSSSGPPADAPDQIAAAEDLGFDSIWTSEAYGSDCFTPLAWWGFGRHCGRIPAVQDHSSAQSWSQRRA